ncbi:MAG TPA: hypothetical protein VLE97_09825 [Gaiellaceae bacterium]|nr:hypothetical protein [Gaiellaceae bacterium]
MNAAQIIEYACRQGFRSVVTETMVTDAIATLPQPFTCRDVVLAIPRDSQGNTVSEYLVALWIDDMLERGQLSWTGAERPRTYRTWP